MLLIVVEVAGTVCDADCSIFSQTVDRQRPPAGRIVRRLESLLRRLNRDDLHSGRVKVSGLDLLQAGPCSEKKCEAPNI